MQTARSIRSINLQNLPTWYSRPSGENIVMCLSNPALLPLAIFLGMDHGYKLRGTDYTTRWSVDYTTCHVWLQHTNYKRDQQIKLVKKASQWKSSTITYVKHITLYYFYGVERTKESIISGRLESDADKPNTDWIKCALVWLFNPFSLPTDHKYKPACVISAASNRISATITNSRWNCKWFILSWL